MKETLECEMCGVNNTVDPSVELTLDPYAFEIYDESVERVLCSNCCYQLSLDV
jgi:predicted nucleic-acid-binding Zn-ribbon protein